MKQEKHKVPDVPVFVQTGEAAGEWDQWQQITEEEARFVYDMTLRNELSGGTPVVREFEEAWREMTGLRYALTTCNGTLALYSALYGLGIGPGDEVICPTYTWICTISPALFLGARPVFCDCDRQTMQIAPEDIHRRITPRTRAIIVVHLWGWVADMDAVMAISAETGVPLIEDCSHAHGALYQGRPVGSLGHVGCWSLQGTKPVSAGEGGVLATNDAEVFDRACLVGQVNRMAGMDLQTTSYGQYQPLGTGMKLRAHPLGIGVALVQLRKLDALNDSRRRYVEEIEAHLAEIPGLRPVPTYPGTQRGGYYAFPIHVDARDLGAPAGALVDLLKARGIPASTSAYPLLHRLPLFAEGFDLFTRDRGPLGKDWPGYTEGDFPAAEQVHRDLLFLPMLTKPAPGVVERILKTLKECARELRTP